MRSLSTAPEPRTKTMATYLIASYDVDDPRAFEAYGPAVMPLLQKHGAELVVADRDARVVEGERREVNVVLRFQSEAAALGFIHDPEYEPVKAIRLRATSNGTVILTDQFVPPAP